MRKLLLILILPVSSMAGGFALSGIGGKALSLGGSYVSLVSDWTAIYWNPAGLTGASKQIGIYTNVIGTFGDATTQTGIIGMDGPFSLKNYPINTQQSFLIPAFGFVLPYKENVFAFGLYVPFGLGAKWDLYSLPIGYRDDGIDNYPKIDHESSIEVLNIVGGYARKFSSLSVGISLGLSRTSILLRKVNFAILDGNKDGSPDLGYPYSLIPVDVKLTGTGFGFVANLGLKYELSKLSFAWALRFNSSPTLKGNIEANAYLPKSDYYYYKMSNNPIFLGGISNSKASGSAQLKLPIITDFGISYKFNEKLLSAVFFQYQNWSTFDEIILSIDSANQTGDPLLGKFLPSQEEFVQGWKSTFKFGMGIEYRFKSNLPLRFGFAFDQSPIPDSTFNPLIPDPGNKIQLTAGFSREYNNFSYDFNFEYFILPKKTISNTDYNPLKSHNLPGEYRFSLFAVGFGINYKF
ncbi:MAG: outer membrane protein transport protein [candidate division WOR-3 bacterium]